MPLPMGYLCGTDCSLRLGALLAPGVTLSRCKSIWCERFINVMDSAESPTFTRMNVPLSYIRPMTENHYLTSEARCPRLTLSRGTTVASIGKLNRFLSIQSIEDHYLKMIIVHRLTS